jgi:hypothetical protein
MNKSAISKSVEEFVRYVTKFDLFQYVMQDLLWISMAENCKYTAM